MLTSLFKLNNFCLKRRKKNSIFLFISLLLFFFFEKDIRLIHSFCLLFIFGSKKFHSVMSHKQTVILSFTNAVKFLKEFFPPLQNPIATDKQISIEKSFKLIWFIDLFQGKTLCLSYEPRGYGSSFRVNQSLVLSNNKNDN